MKTLSQLLPEVNLEEQLEPVDLPSIFRQYPYDMRFVNLPIKDFSPERRYLPNPKENAISIAAQENTISIAAGMVQRISFQAAWALLLEQPQVSQIQALVIGRWWTSTDPVDCNANEVVNLLVQSSAQLPNLHALLFGNIKEDTFDPIQQPDISPLYAAFPQLTTLKLRGHKGLSLGQMAHSALTTLIITSDGLDPCIIQQLSQAQLPALTHLEIGLGKEVGKEQLCTPESLLGLLHPELFPQLRYFGLRSSDNIDSIVPIIVTSPFIQRLQVLDFSLGNLSDKGAQALLTSPYLSGLKLDLHHHYISSTMMQTLVDARLDANLDEQCDQADIRVHQFIFASE